MEAVEGECLIISTIFICVWIIIFKNKWEEVVRAIDVYLHN